MRRFSKVKATYGSMRVETKPCWSLFTWRECSTCNEAFRREPGWSVRCGEFRTDNNYTPPETHFMCFGCAEHINDATRKIVGKKIGDRAVQGVWTISKRTKDFSKFVAYFPVEVDDADDDSNE